MTDHKAEAEKFLHNSQTMFWDETTWPDIAAYHAAAQVHATLYLAEQQNMSNRMQYAIDFATGDEHYAELGREIGAALGVTA